MIDARHIAERLRGAEVGEVKLNHTLAPYTSYQVGGTATIWVVPESVKAVGQALRIINEEKAPLFVMGGGCNLLVSDSGWQGVALYIGDNLSGWSFEGNDVTVLAGSVLLNLISETVDCGLGGMECMAGIPGRVGGALRMNAGAFGQEIGTSVVSVEGFTQSGEPVSLKREEIRFGYRSAPELEDKVIVSTKLRLMSVEIETLRTRMKDVLAQRNEKQPLEYPSCGSVFKRPAGQYAGALIEEAGMKGQQIGGAMVSTKHAGFILNTGGATATDIFNLIRRIETAVKDKFGIELEREVKLAGWQDECDTE